MLWPDNTFTVHQDISLGIHESVFSGFFDHVAFKEWRDKNGSWQLRVIGSPGSGKTILSAVTARQLKTHFEQLGQCVPVATIFVRKKDSSNDSDFMRRFLIGVLAQFLTGPPQSREPLSQLSLDELQNNLRDTISSLGKAFLIVDDVDVCDRAFEIVKTKLLQLQEVGLKIMATSRIPLSYDTDEWDCDSDGSHTRVPLYWACRDCFFVDDRFDMDNALLVCNQCKARDEPCVQCSKTEFLQEPYSSVDLKLEALIGLDDLAFQDFLAQELEIVHGDIGLCTEIETPPNSLLGKEIRNTSYDASALVRTILEPGYNIAFAKVRLSIYQEAQTIEELEKTKDRLPPKFLLLFDAAIRQITQQKESEKMLGLVALHVAQQAREKVPFSLLEARLQSKGLLERDQPENHNISRVLRATCGLLSVDMKEELFTELFHPLLDPYVYDHYNEDLARAASYKGIHEVE